MSYQDIRKAKAIEQKNKTRLLEVNPKLDDGSGIYFLTRIDEDGIKYAYIGQAKHILTRLAQHLVGYQHIDLSMKKHGLYSEDNKYGWNVNFLNYPLTLLDDMEQVFIKQYAKNGYQLRNKTAGGQGEGKEKINEFKPSKGYRDGLAQGYKNAVKEIKNIIDKHLIVTLKPDKTNNKVSQKAFDKFNEILNYKTEE